MSILRFRYLLTAMAILIVLSGAVAVTAAVWLVPAVHWRAKVFWMKATGALQDIEWGELVRFSRPGSPYYLTPLADSPNPFAAILNPYHSVPDIENGKRVFHSSCSTCHGANGSGAAGGPSLLGRQLALGDSDWAVFRTIAHGIRGTAMRGFSFPIRDLWQLVAYVKTLTSQTPAASQRSIAVTNPPAPVSYQDLLHAAQLPDRWLMYSGAYDSRRFSTAKQITPANADGLRLLWMRQYETTKTVLETTPLVVGGYMFVTVQPNQVEALDVQTGSLIWSYHRTLPERLSICCGFANRGLAVRGDKLFLGTLDAHLVALNMSTGHVCWDVEVADYKAGYSITSAPLALKDSVVTGVAGGEFGIRGFIEGYDINTGKSRWRFDTVPGPGQPGSETWQGNSWKTGGGPTWLTGSYDPELNLIYWPVGNPSPEFSGDARSGDNLYTNSVVALDADRGTLRWYFQFTPHDEFDWDATEILMLLRANVAGKDRNLLVQADRNGFYYVLNRETGEFLKSSQFAKQTWAERVDNSGRALKRPAAHPTGRGTALYPGNVGATNWQPPSYSPETKLVYIPAMEIGSVYFSASAKYVPGSFFLGGLYQDISNDDQGVVVRALNSVSGELRWEYRGRTNQTGGLLSTAGGLVFGSHGSRFFALDADTGRELWKLETGGQIAAAPITFLHQGRQRVVIAAGHNLMTFGL